MIRFFLVLVRGNSPLCSSFLYFIRNNKLYFFNGGIDESHCLLSMFKKKIKAGEVIEILLQEVALNDEWNRKYGETINKIIRDNKEIIRDNKN